MEGPVLQILVQTALENTAVDQSYAIFSATTPKRFGLASQKDSTRGPSTKLIATRFNYPYSTTPDNTVSQKLD